MVEIDILTKNENYVLNKRLSYGKLNQVESNYLSRAIRPKLKMLKNSKELNVDLILQKLQYNQKGLSIEKKLKILLLKLVPKTISLVIYGSAIQNNYSSYNDIDVLIITKNNFWHSERAKYCLIKNIRDLAGAEGLKLDIQIMGKKEFYLQYPSSPDLIYQLKDSKVIYGKLELPKKIKLSKINLYMKLDWSDIEETTPSGNEIYKAIRNALLVKLLFNKIIDNQKLKDSLFEQLGNYLLEKLKNNSESKLERRFALNYLKDLCEKIREDIKDVAWEKIEL